MNFIWLNIYSLRKIRNFVSLKYLKWNLSFYVLLQKISEVFHRYNDKNKIFFIRFVEQCVLLLTEPFYPCIQVHALRCTTMWPPLVLVLCGARQPYGAYA